MKIYNLPITSETSLLTVYTLETGQISLLYSQGKEKPLGIIKSVIATLVDYFSVIFSDSQLTEFSQTFYDKFYYWHLADLKRFMECCKGLNFGKPYGAVSVVTLMDWANNYDAERWLMINNLLKDEYQQLKAQEKHGL